MNEKYTLFTLTPLLEDIVRSKLKQLALVDENLNELSILLLFVNVKNHMQSLWT